MALPVNGSTHLIPAYYSFIDPERMKGWVGLVGWLVANGLPTLVVTHQLQVERKTGKVRKSETDVLPLCYATNIHDNIPCNKKICNACTVSWRAESEEWATTTGNMYWKFWKVWAYGYSDNQADRHTDKHWLQCKNLKEKRKLVKPGSLEIVTVTKVVVKTLFCTKAVIPDT